jgi:hypothetical protein
MALGSARQMGCTHSFGPPDTRPDSFATTSAMATVTNTSAEKGSFGFIFRVLDFQSI